MYIYQTALIFLFVNVNSQSSTSTLSSSPSATASSSVWPSISASVSTSSLPGISVSPVSNLGPSRTPSSTKTFGFLNVSDCLVTNRSFYKDGIISYAITTAPSCLNTTKGPIIVEITLGSLANVLLQPYALACFSIVLLFVLLISYKWLRYKRQQIEEIVEQSYLEKAAKILSEKAKKRRKEEVYKLKASYSNPLPEFTKEHLSKVAKSMNADFSLEPRVEPSKMSRMNAITFVSKRSVASSGKRLIKFSEDIALTEGNQIKVTNNPLRPLYRGNNNNDSSLYNLGSLVTQSSGMAALQEISSYRTLYNPKSKFIQVVEKTLEGDEEFKEKDDNNDEEEGDDGLEQREGDKEEEEENGEEDGEEDDDGQDEEGENEENSNNNQVDNEEEDDR